MVFIQVPWVNQTDLGSHGGTWGVLGGSEISQYLVLKHLLYWPKPILFLNEISWYLSTICTRKFDFTFRGAFISSENHYFTTFLTLSKIFQMILHLSFTKVVFVIVIFQKILGMHMYFFAQLYVISRNELTITMWMNSYVIVKPK